MSTTLPEDAPVEESAAPSVEEPAPESSGEVDEESVGGGETPKTVPADRFNGLMGRFNRTQSELQAERERAAELEARLKETESNQEATPEVSDTSSLEARVDQLTELLTTERLENARTQALKDHPEAAPFADLIVADSPDDIREMTRLIADRVKTSNPTPNADETDEVEDGGEEPSGSEDGATPEAEAEGETSGGNEPPVAGGGAAFNSEASADDRVADAIESRSFSDFINAKWEQKVISEGDANLEVG